MPAYVRRLLLFFLWLTLSSFYFEDQSMMGKPVRPLSCPGHDSWHNTSHRMLFLDYRPIGVLMIFRTLPFAGDQFPASRLILHKGRSWKDQRLRLPNSTPLCCRGSSGYLSGREHVTSLRSAMPS